MSVVWKLGKLKDKE